MIKKDKKKGKNNLFALYAPLKHLITTTQWQ